MAKKPIKWSKILGILGIIFEGLGGMFDRLSDRFEREEGNIRLPTPEEKTVVDRISKEYE